MGIELVWHRTVDAVLTVLNSKCHRNGSWWLAQLHTHTHTHTHVEILS